MLGSHINRVSHRAETETETERQRKTDRQTETDFETEPSNKNKNHLNPASFFLFLWATLWSEAPVQNILVWRLYKLFPMSPSPAPNVNFQTASYTPSPSHFWDSNVLLHALVFISCYTVGWLYNWPYSSLTSRLWFKKWKISFLSW